MSDIIDRVASITDRYWKSRFAEFALGLTSSPFFDLMLHQHRFDPKWRYRHKSRRDQPHKFGAGDAKAVLRQIRRGRHVSSALINRAAQALIREGYDRGYDAGADANY